CSFPSTRLRGTRRLRLASRDGQPTPEPTITAAKAASRSTRSVTARPDPTSESMIGYEARSSARPAARVGMVAGIGCSRCLRVQTNTGLTGWWAYYGTLITGLPHGFDLPN